MLERDFPLVRQTPDTTEPGLYLGNYYMIPQSGKLASSYSRSPHRYGVETRRRVLEKVRENAVAKRTFNALDWMPRLGTDPEVFGATHNGEVVSAYKVLPKTGEVFWDGVQAEFKVVPAYCLEVLAGSICERIRTLHHRYVKHGAKLIAESCVPLSDKFMRGASHEELMFGCNPSRNAYQMTGEEAHPRMLRYRFAGGHWHFGRLKFSTPDEYVRVLDQTLGLVGTAFATRDNPIRRRYYGLAGEYRIPGRGRLEYRTLSNFWIYHPALVHMTGMIGRAALTLADLGMDDWFGFKQEDVVETINSTDVKSARDMLESVQGKFEGFLYNSGFREPEQTFKAIMRGLDIVPNLENFIYNWIEDAGWTNSWNCAKFVKGV